MQARPEVEVLWPGTWIDAPDHEIAHTLGMQLELIQGAFDEAAMSALLFTEAQREAHDPIQDQSFGIDVEIRRAIELPLDAPGARSTSYDREAFERRQLEIAKEIVREKWRRGLLPRSLKHRVPFIYAKAFLSSAEMMGKHLAQVAANPSVPVACRGACLAFYSAFPTLRPIRNSVQHEEDRALLRGPSGKAIDLKPVDSSGIRAPGGVMIISSLAGDLFSSTMADGHLGEIAVNLETVGALRDSFERVLNAFAWRGPTNVRPQ